MEFAGATAQRRVRECLQSACQFCVYSIVQYSLIKRPRPRGSAGESTTPAHKVAQVAQGSSKLSPRGAQTAQSWTPRGTQNPQNLTFEHQGMGTRNRPAKGCPQPSKCKPLSLENGAQTTDKKSQIGPELRNGTNQPTTQ